MKEHEGFYPLSTENIQTITEDRSSFSERLADYLTDSMGSWTFINGSLLCFALWFGLNIFTPLKFDPVPFLILNLTLGVVSALQTPIIIISQKSIDRKNHIRNEIQYDMIKELHEKIDRLEKKNEI
jgi:uncharacterized membrane protein